MSFCEKQHQCEDFLINEPKWTPEIWVFATCHSLFVHLCLSLWTLSQLEAHRCPKHHLCYLKVKISLHQNLRRTFYAHLQNWNPAFAKHKCPHTLGRKAYINMNPEAINGDKINQYHIEMTHIFVHKICIPKLTCVQGQKWGKSLENDEIQNSSQLLRLNQLHLRFCSWNIDFPLCGCLLLQDLRTPEEVWGDGIKPQSHTPLNAPENCFKIIIYMKTHQRRRPSGLFKQWGGVATLSLCWEAIMTREKQLSSRVIWGDSARASSGQKRDSRVLNN